MSVIFDSTFQGTAGASVKTSIPQIGSSLVHVSGHDEAVLVTGGGTRGGTAHFADDWYGVVGEYEGYLTDISFGVKCNSDDANGTIVAIFDATTNNIQAGLFWGASAQWSLVINGGVAGAVPVNPSPGRTYICRLVVTPYTSMFWVDGNLLFTGAGTDAIGFVGTPQVRVDLTGVTRLSDTDGYQLNRLRVRCANPRPTQRDIPSGIADGLALEATSLCMCYLLALADGTLMGFTTHDQDLTLDWQLYNAMSSVQATNVRFQTGGQPDNLDVNGLLSSDLITEEDMLAGRYDNAQITILMCDWSDLSAGSVELLRGNIGDVKVQDNQYTASVRSQMQRYQQQLVEATSATCRVFHLGDERCKIDLSGNTAGGDAIQSNGTVSIVTDPFVLEFTGIVAKAGFYQNGTVLGLTGPNTGYIREVKLHSQSNRIDVITVNASNVPASNITYRQPLDFTSSVIPVIPVPGGYWRQANLLVNSTWRLKTALTVGTDQLCLQLPIGQQYDTVLRESATPSSFGVPGSFNDSQLFGTETLFALNTISYAGSGSLQMGLRHTAAVGTGAPFFNVTIDNVQIEFVGTLASTSSRLILHEPFPFPVSVGDTFQLTAGCDRTNSACTLKFNNIVNFRGEPQVPGVDALMQRGRPPA